MMIWLRSGLFLVLLALSVILFGLPIILLGRWVPYHNLILMARWWGRLVLFLLRVTCKLGYRVHGLENLPEEGAIVLCNHQSAWETIALRGLLPPAQTWVLKKELIGVPVFGGALAAFDPIAIDRSAGRRAVRQLLEQGQRALALGRWIIIFPEGTRAPPGEMRAFGIGGALLAERSGRQIVPIAHNAGIFWGRRSFRKRPGTVDLVIGPPIPTIGRKAQELNRMVEAWIRDTLSDLPDQPQDQG